MMIDVNVPAQHRALANDDRVRNTAIVSNVGLAHQITVTTDAGVTIFFFGSSIDRYALADHVVVANRRKHQNPRETTGRVIFYCYLLLLLVVLQLAVIRRE